MALGLEKLGVLMESEAESVNGTNSGTKERNGVREGTQP